MGRAYVVTGGGRGIGRAVVERLLGTEDTVVAIERDPAALAWTGRHPRIVAVVGDAADEAVTERAADRAQAAGTLTGWVNNAAVFRDASVHSAPTREVLDLIAANLHPAVVGCATAVRRFLAAGTGGAIVNVSSHQAGRAVPGCLPYVTAKAAVEGLTRALAVEYGPRGIRVNAVALGSIATDGFAAPDRPGRPARGGGGHHCLPALRRGRPHHRSGGTRRRRPVGARPRPGSPRPPVAVRIARSGQDRGAVTTEMSSSATAAGSTIWCRCSPGMCRTDQPRARASAATRSYAGPNSTYTHGWSAQPSGTGTACSKYDSGRRGCSSVTTRRVSSSGNNGAISSSPHQSVQRGNRPSGPASPFREARNSSSVAGVAPCLAGTSASTNTDAATGWRTALRTTGTNRPALLCATRITPRSGGTSARAPATAAATCRQAGGAPAPT